MDPVFNETVQIVEFDEGFDTETFFLYVTLAGLVMLLLFLGYDFVSGSYLHHFKIVESVLALMFYLTYIRT